MNTSRNTSREVSIGSITNSQLEECSPLSKVKYFSLRLNITEKVCLVLLFYFLYLLGERPTYHWRTAGENLFQVGYITMNFPRYQEQKAIVSRLEAKHKQNMLQRFSQGLIFIFDELIYCSFVFSYSLNLILIFL